MFARALFRKATDFFLPPLVLFEAAGNFLLEWRTFFSPRNYGSEEILVRCAIRALLLYGSRFCLSSLDLLKNTFAEVSDSFFFFFLEIPRLPFFPISQAAVAPYFLCILARHPPPKGFFFSLFDDAVPGVRPPYAATPIFLGLQRTFLFSLSLTQSRRCRGRP